MERMSVWECVCDEGVRKEGRTSVRKSYGDLYIHIFRSFFLEWPIIPSVDNRKTIDIHNPDRCFIDISKLHL